MPNIDYEVRGLEEGFIDAEVRIRGERGLSAQIRKLAEDAGKEAARVMRVEVPKGKSAGRNTIVGSIRSTEAVFHPGGAGGGGFYEVHAGPDPDTAPEHTRYVLQGTGTYYEDGPRIRAHQPWQAMPMRDKGGNLIFRMSHAGQEANSRWYDEGVAAAEVHIATNIHRLNT